MDYDIIVIGAGSGGQNIAGFMNKSGFKVLLIDKSEEEIGGDCLNYGCVPSKALIHVSRMIHNARQSDEFGLNISGKTDLKKVKEYLKSKQQIIRNHESVCAFKKQGIDIALGKARFGSHNSVIVSGKEYTGKKIVIATGSRPRTLDIPGIDKVSVLTNETIFDLETLPEKFLIIGGGPIGMELGQAFSRFGSKVTIVDTDDIFLPKESYEIADVLRQQLEKEGVEFLFNTKPIEFKSSNEVFVEKNRKKEILTFDNVLISIGRQLNIEELDLEKAGIEVQGYKLKVDPYLRTTNKNVFVSGDMVGSYQFTHAAELHTGILIKNMILPVKSKVNYDHLSWVTYTDPEIATFGLNENELKKRGIAYEKLILGFEEDDRAIVGNYQYGKLVLFIKPSLLGNASILGGSMVAPHAGELFQELVLANSTGMGVKSFLDKIYPYPTASRVNQKIMANYMGKLLSPRVKSIMRKLY